MKKQHRFICFVIAVMVFVSLIIPAYSVDEISDSIYTYSFDIHVDNPCNSNDMDDDAVCVLYFQYSYTDNNGYGTKQTEKFDMSWKNGKNSNADFLKKHFIRSNDNSYDTTFTVDLSGKLNQVYIKLNMDGGERLKFTVRKITCNGIRINNNTDYVSSAYYDSEAKIGCSMAKSMIDPVKSPFFSGKSTSGLTQLQLDEIMASKDDTYDGQFVDQFGAVINADVIDKCITKSDGSINQNLLHTDEPSMYYYTFYVNVENPINLTDTDDDSVDDFVITLDYIADNGYGQKGSYSLDMSYDESLGRNLNPDYLSLFSRDNDNGYHTSFKVWIPGVLTNVKCLLNMGSERLTFRFEKIALNGLTVNTKQDYVSSAVWDSNAEVPCFVPNSEVQTSDKTLLKDADRTALYDQYGVLVSDTLFELAVDCPEKYLYHYSDIK